MTGTTARTRPAVLVAAVAGLTLVITLMLVAFASPSVHSGAHSVPVGVVGDDGLAAALNDPENPDAFEVSTFSSAEALREAVLDRDVVGGFVQTPGHLDIMTAAGAGTPYVTLLTTTGTAIAGDRLAVGTTELAPMTAQDPNGSGIASLALPLVFGGMMSNVALGAVLRGGRGRTRVAATLVFSVATGLATTAFLQFALDAVDGSFWLTAAGVAAGIAAISTTLLGLGNLLAGAGTALGAVIMLMLSNPLSGAAVGPYWLPRPWGDIGQLLPVGAATWVARSGAFFDGRGAGHGWVVLAVWFLFGALLVLLAHRRTARRGQHVAQDGTAARTSTAPGGQQVTTHEENRS